VYQFSEEQELRKVLGDWLWGFDVGRDGGRKLQS
jgi:hypothetical protein